MLAGGCASAPERICDLERTGLSRLPIPPPESEALLAQVLEGRPKAMDAARFHWVWLASAEGELFLCTYRRRPVVTTSCGVTVYRYTKTADGYEAVTTSISAC
jgi:hypothetical protein